ncbi:YncE family protein [Mycobacterium sp. E2699]|uniref:YncE family protein n=1 Tax=Mycobacterium sp. E2699 TaxID=1834137 RepID=UPI000ADA6C25|nr:YncE family protein [Mycobacterium sp. E2699]
MKQPGIDPNADPSRRAWLACPNCDHGAGCAECQSRRNCGTHWQYLLKNTASRVFLQCPTCFCTWTVDTAERDRQDPAQPRFDGVVAAEISLGDCPRDIVTSPSGEFVYVLTADSVQAVDHLHHVVATIPIGAEPRQMLMSPDGSRIYVVAYDGALSIIDPVSMTSETFAKPRCTAAVVSLDGDHIYLAHDDAFADGAGAWVSAIRADGAAVAFAAIDGFVTGMALSPDGRLLYAASGATDEARGGTITVIDTASYKAVDFIAVDEGPESITVDAEGLLYVTHFRINSVSVVDPGTHCAISVGLDDAPMELVARPGTEFVYSANTHSVTVIDTTTAATTRVMAGELPRRLSISPDGRRVYAADFGTGTVWALDTSDNTVVATAAVCAHPAAVTLSPDGRLLYVTDSRRGTLIVISTALLDRK